MFEVKIGSDLLRVRLVDNRPVLGRVGALGKILSSSLGSCGTGATSYWKATQSL